MSSPGAAARTRRRPVLLILSLALSAATLAVYHGVLRADFVFDDDQYLLQRTHLRDGLTLENARWAFTTFHASNWHPLAWLSHLLDISLFGMQPAGHHGVNVLLHVFNAVLLLWLLARLTGRLRRSALVAALFALHPLHVESVAWIAERKDVLCAAFFLAGLEAYRRYATKPGAARYLAVALLFSLGLLSKPMAVTFPFVLLLLDWWPLGRLGRARPGGGSQREQAGRLILEKMPLLLLSVGSGLVTVAAQRAGASLIDTRHLGWSARLANAAISYARYLGDTFLPAGLAVFYPLPEAGYPAWQFPAALLLVLGLTAAAAGCARRRPWLATGWFWYLGMLVPVIGLLQVGRQSHADRYTYLPLVGIFLALLWEAGERAGRDALPRWVRPAAATAVLVALALLSARQVGTWRDQRTLFTHARDVTGGNVVTATNLAAAAGREGRLDEAAALYREALRFSPQSFEPTYGLASILVRQGAVAAGIVYYRAAAGMRPRVAEVWFNLGAAAAQAGGHAEAAAAYRRALALETGLVEAHMNLGNVLSDMGESEAALAAYADALRLAPGKPEVLFNRGLVLESLGRRREAARDYREALRRQPGYRAAQLGLVRLGVSQTAGEGAGSPR
jgi:Tfp pilus assembly protein PilF